MHQQAPGPLHHGYTAPDPAARLPGRYNGRARPLPGDRLRPAIRRQWLADNPLPQSIRYYSLVTLPSPDQVSSVLKGMQKKLATVDSRNDSQVIFYDQNIPGSTLLGYLNADHWAIAVPIAESHAFIGRHFADRNNYPRQAVFEAMLRFIEEDMDLE